jgi:hypothetical protein
VDLARASDQIDQLIDKRAEAAGRANAEEELWKASVRQHNARLRLQRQGEWYCYFSALADSLRRSAEEYERRAEQLLKEPDRGEGRR